MNDLDDVTVAERQRGVSVPVTKNRSVVLDYDEPGIYSKRSEQACNRAVTLQLPWCSVHHQGDYPARFRRLNHMLKYSA